MNQTNFETALAKFVENVQARYNAYWEKQGYTFGPPPTIYVDSGARKYARIVREESGRSVFCFIDVATGDVLKAAGWKAPAKHARGNIYSDQNGMEALPPLGAHPHVLYMK